MNNKRNVQCASNLWNSREQTPRKKKSFYPQTHSQPASIVRACPQRFRNSRPGRHLHLVLFVLAVVGDSVGNIHAAGHRCGWCQRLLITRYSDQRGARFLLLPPPPPRRLCVCFYIVRVFSFRRLSLSEYEDLNLRGQRVTNRMSRRSCR